LIFSIKAAVNFLHEYLDEGRPAYFADSAVSLFLDAGDASRHVAAGQSYAVHLFLLAQTANHAPRPSVRPEIGQMHHLIKLPKDKFELSQVPIIVVLEL